jgi:hypothetical protein
MLGLEFDSAEDLFHWIRDKFERMHLVVLENVFESWINHLENRIQCEGDYFPKNQITAKAVPSEITRKGQC